METLLLIFFVIFLIPVSITFVVLLWVIILDLIEDTEFGEWALQKIKKKKRGEWHI